jgi:GNAT superfamily N-acetyltransferase
MSTNSIVIRHANINDIPEISPLLAQLGYPCDLKDLRARFKRFIQNPGYGVVVACLDERLVGWVAWSKSELLILDKTRFNIEGLVVDEKFRGQGIGKKLMDFVEDFVREYTPSVIDVTSGVRRAKDGTHEFYKKLGYSHDGPKAKIFFRKEI